MRAFRIGTGSDRAWDYLIAGEGRNRQRRPGERLDRRLESAGQEPPVAVGTGPGTSSNGAGRRVPKMNESAVPEKGWRRNPTPAINRLAGWQSTGKRCAGETIMPASEPAGWRSGQQSPITGGRFGDHCVKGIRRTEANGRLAAARRLETDPGRKRCGRIKDGIDRCQRKIGGKTGNKGWLSADRRRPAPEGQT